MAVFFFFWNLKFYSGFNESLIGTPLIDGFNETRIVSFIISFIIVHDLIHRVKQHVASLSLSLSLFPLRLCRYTVVFVIMVELIEWNWRLRNMAD